ncbi:MAG TPA: hypothetical protein VFK05_11300 [Polyangiaceae bacterium]|nr:hypothetical protein [Polyangiaceae bacterium]
MRVALALGVLAVVLGACSSSRRVPPGTPPPEYEPPIVPAWSSESGDAGTDASVPSAKKAAQPPNPPESDPELSLDAGPR